MNSTRRMLLSSIPFGIAMIRDVWSQSPPAREYFVYFGTYTGYKSMRLGEPGGKSDSKGIYVSRFRVETGDVSEPELAAETPNPSFLVIHPNRRFLYCVNEDPKSVGSFRDKASTVSAFAIDPVTGKLRFVNAVPSGGTSCYASLDESGKFLFVANYGTGNLYVLPIKADGSVGTSVDVAQHSGKSVDPVYQTGPHAHSADIAAGNRFLVSSELGADTLMVYRFDATTGKLTLNPAATVNAKPKTGPRHFAFSANGKFGYSLGEMSGTITAFAWEGSKGTLKEIQVIETKPKNLPSAGSAELTIHPNGRFIYASNRGPDTIVVLAIHPTNGTLTPVDEVASRGMAPRSFGIDPTGSYLLAANQATDDVVIFRVDGETGRILPTRNIVKVSTPVCVKFLALS